MDQWVTIRTLKMHNPKIGTREIARLLGISRNTVKRALRSDSEPEYVRPPTVNPEIEPFREFIFEELVVKKLRGSRILNDLRSKGCKASRSAFYRYLATLELPVARTYHRYETAPGEQAQFDWSPYTVLLGGTLTKIYVFCFILGYSRYRIYQASLSEKQSSVFDAMETSMWQIGGVTSRTQVDNFKGFVTDANPKHLVWNPRYLAFAAHWGFEVSRSLPAHAWSKGKVENPFDYLCDQFIAGNSWLSFGAFCQALERFQEEVNDRVHDTTHEKPRLLFEQERSALKALPASRYVGTSEEVRTSTADCLVSFEGSRYSVPDLFALREVWVRVVKGYLLEISSSQGAVIAVHKLSLVKGAVVIDERHYTSHHRIERGSWDRLALMFLERFPLHQAYLERLKAQKRISPAYHLTRVMELADYYESSHLEAAFGACHQYNTYSANFVKGYLEHHGRPSAHTKEEAAQPARFVCSLSGAPSIQRPLREYADLLHQLSLPLTNKG